MSQPADSPELTFLRTCFEQSVSLWVEVMPDGGVVRANPACTHWLGRSNDNWLMAQVPRERERARLWLDGLVESTGAGGNSPFCGGGDVHSVCALLWRGLASGNPGTFLLAGTPAGFSAQSEQAHTARLVALGAMSSGLAHEVNQPLSAISNYTHGCLRRLRQGTIGPEQVLGVLEAIAKQSQRAAGIVQRMRDFSARREYRRTRVDINDLVREACGFMTPQIEAENIRLRLQSGDSPHYVVADKVQIEQVLLNLLQNAVDALRSLKSEREIRVTVQRAGDRIAIRVEDSGEGVPAGLRQQIFTPFFSTRADGVGLGLAISTSLIEAHGGQLVCEPPSGKGGCFVVSLPAAV